MVSSVTILALGISNLQKIHQGFRLYSNKWLSQQVNVANVALDSFLIVNVPFVLFPSNLLLLSVNEETVEIHLQDIFASSLKCNFEY